MADPADDKRKLMAEVARLYYEESRTQSEIARQMTVSRSTVSRLLAEARRSKLVELVIHYPWRTDSDLEAALVCRFGLKDARVLKAEGRPYPEILRGLGALAAQLLESRLADGVILGISWGAAVHATVQALRPKQRVGITVVQMQGAMGDKLMDGPEVARRLATLCGGEFRYVHAPVMVESPLICEALLQESSIRETLALAAQADLALVGIGSLDPAVSSAFRSGALLESDLLQLAQQGAVGDVCGRHFDAEGNFLDIGLNRRLVGISPEALKNIPVVIGVAGGQAKVPSIQAALRGRLVNVLVTDSEVAECLLRPIPLDGSAEAVSASAGLQPKEMLS
jgi:DNA-binding transcriptional regulator LsrR (DeoR family)